MAKAASASADKEKLKAEKEEQVKKKTTAKAKKTTKKTVKKAKTSKKEVKKSSAKGKKQAAVKEPQTMDELLAMTGYELRGFRRGEIVEGLVTDISKKMVLIDIGGKTEGMVVDREYEAARDLIEELKVGDTVKVQVIQPENERGQILLSLRQAAMAKKWEFFERALKTGEVVEVRGLEINKGGIIVRAKGMRGFVPASQFSRRYLGKLEELHNKLFAVKVIEVDREKNRLIFSEKEVSEALDKEERQEAIEKVKVGEVYEGVVSGVMPFGVFVRVTIEKKKDGKDLYLEGLVHISEVSWEKVGDLNKFYKAGDRVKVKVMGVDKKSGKLTLSIKRLKGDPWEKIEEKYPEGAKVKGTVTRLVAFGAFVNLEPGVDGLIHISKIPAETELKVGQKIDCFVESVDVENRRMSLGLVLAKKPVGYK